MKKENNRCLQAVRRVLAAALACLLALSMMPAPARATASQPICLTETTTAEEAQALLGENVVVTGEPGSLTLTLTGNMSLAVPLIVESGAHTLDLQTHTLSYTAADEDGCLRVTGGELSIDGDDSWGAITADNVGTGSAGVSGILTVSGGKVTLKGGSITRGENGCVPWAAKVAGGHFTMTGGTLAGDSQNGGALYVTDASYVTLSGGAISGGAGSTLLQVETGSIGELLDELCDYYNSADQKLEDTSGNTLSGWHTIVKGSAGAEYTTDGGANWTKCKTLSDALTGIGSANDAAQYKVRLLADNDTSFAIVTGKVFTLDLNGFASKSWEASGATRLTVTDSKGGGSITGADATAQAAARSAVLVSGANAAVTLSGENAFTLQGGKGDDDGLGGKGDGAPGVRVEDGGSLTVSGTGNIAVRGGDGGSQTHDVGSTGGVGVSADNAILTITGGSFTGGKGGNGGGWTEAGGISDPNAGGFGGYGISVVNGGSAALSGLTCTGGDGGDNSDSTAKNGRGSGLFINAVDVTVDSGVFDGNSGVSATSDLSAPSRWVINGGAFTGDTDGLSAICFTGTTLSVTGGTFAGGRAAVFTNRAGALSGGTFTGRGESAYAVICFSTAGAAAQSGNLLAGGKAYFDEGGNQVTQGLEANTLGQGATLRVADAASVPAPVYSLSGDVMTSGAVASVAGAKVTLKQGAEIKDTTRTAADGTYAFHGVPAGLYNVAAEAEGQIVTILVELTGDLNNLCITLLPTGKSSVVDVKPGTPAVVVDGMKAIASAEDASGGKTVVVTLTVKADESPADKHEIESVAAGKTVGLYLDLSLLKTVTSGGNTQSTPITDTVSNVLEVVLPYDFTGKTGVAVYRCHDGTAEPLTETDTHADGTYILDETNGLIHIFATKFSTYAVGYTAPTPSGGSGSASVYTLTASAGTGGKISPSGKVSVTRGGSKTFTITPDNGYTVADVLVDGKSVGAVTSYTFEKVTAAHTIAASFKAEPGKAAWNPFTDVRENDWFHDAVRYAYEHGLMRGTSETAFSPAESTERGMIVTILWRMEGQPEAAGARTFSDVDESAYYAKAVEWAQAKGIVLGYGDGTFGPHDPITREQLAAILWRYAGSPAAPNLLLEFSDAGQLSGYADSAMRWAVGKGIVSGKGGGMLDPRGQATRAETAAMLERFAEAEK